MELDHDVQRMLDSADPAAPGFEVMPLEKLRDAVAGMQQVCGPGLPVALVRELTLPGPGTDRLPARLYHPVPGRTLPLVVLAFGGGFVAGSIDVVDTPARQLAVLGEVAVLSVVYRLAPEHPFPAGLDDVVAAVRWASAHAAELGGDATRLGVLGESSGGALAAGAALRLRGDLHPPLAAQVLIYPVLDTELDTASYVRQADGPVLTRAAMRRFLVDYLASGSLENPPAGAMPGREPDLSGMPPTLIAVAEHDPLRTEGEQFASRLRDAGVDAQLRLWEGMPHASWYFDHVSPAAATANQDLAREVGRLLRAGASSSG